MARLSLSADGNGRRLNSASPFFLLNAGLLGTMPIKSSKIGRSLPGNETMKPQSPCAPGRPQAATCSQLRHLVAHSILFFVWITGYGLTSPVLAADTTQPRLAGPPGNVAIVNQSGANIWVGFSGSTIAWGVGCQSTGSATTVEIPAAATCQATAPSTGAASRFCASTASGALNCSNAQQNHQTLIETNFQPSCFNTSNSCIWYDISVIPLNPVPSGYGYCTDCTDPYQEMKTMKPQSPCAPGRPQAATCSDNLFVWTVKREAVNNFASRLA